MAGNNAYVGLEEFISRGSELNALSFMFQRLMTGIWTMIPVKVLAINVAGSLTSPGKVDVQPLVHQIDGDGNQTPHGTIYGLPVFRLQSGLSAVVIDPTVADVGMAIFAQRDISGVTATSAANVPGSRRRFDPADGIYLGGILNGAATQYMQFAAGGITITSPTLVTVNGTTVTVNATTAANITSPNVTLGSAAGAKKVALDGDPVVAGVIVASSTKVKAS